ncbi:MAG: hypothetical protein QOF31_3147, partial [Mycobacterium sp.]|nr:hypothetical protein [Mycobacterium sp.]
LSVGVAVLSPLRDEIGRCTFDHVLSVSGDDDHGV